MAYNNYNKIEYNDEEYYMRDSRAILIKSTHAGGSAWTGSLPEGIDSYDDLIVDYFLQRNSDNNPVELSLGALPAKPILRSHDDVQVTKEFGAGCIIRLAYIDTLNNGNGAWKVIGSDASGQGGGGTLDPTYTEVVGSVSLSAGTQADLQTENIDCHEITEWDPDTKPTDLKIENGVLIVTPGVKATLDFDPKTVKSVKTFTKNTLQTLSPVNKTVLEKVEMVQPED